MATAIGWYGPLIDLSKAAFHIGDFVQLLVFVHRCTPVQYKLSKGGEVVRTDIQVGDDTMSFFSVSLWQKQMATMVVAGDVILLQNVKITKFRGVVEATTVQFSSLLCLLHPYQLIVSKGVDDLIRESRAGKTTMEKLVKVIEWVQRTGSSLWGIGSNSFERFCHLSLCFFHVMENIIEYERKTQKNQLPRNWKVPEQSESRDFFLLSEVLLLRKSCKAIFNASAGEIFLPITWRALSDSEKENMFVSRRIVKVKDSNIIEDFTCVGCQLCGFPLDSEDGSIIKQNTSSFYCPKASDHCHVVGWIYRPFMLYVWDESDYVPLLVRNKAAELLFGNIKAERVYSSYGRQKHNPHCDQKDVCKVNIPEANEKASADTRSLGADENQNIQAKLHPNDINFHLIWLILVKMLLQQGKNSSLKFEVAVNPTLDIESGKFEMVSVSIPCIQTKCSSC